MSSHSRKPPYANDPRAVWRHCRRPGCGARPYIPSKVDPAMCEGCAAEYARYGRKYCPGCDKWLLRSAFSPNKGRCRPCSNALAAERRNNPDVRARDIARCKAWRDANPDHVQAYRVAYQPRDNARKRLRRQVDPVYAERERENQRRYRSRGTNAYRTYWAARGREARKRRMLQQVQRGGFNAPRPQ